MGMRDLRTLLGYAALWLLSGSQPVLADDPLGCDTVLITNTTQTLSNSSLQAVFIQSITEDAWKELKSKGSSANNASGGALVFDFGSGSVDISSFNTWDDFQAARQTYLNNVSYTKDTQSSQSYLSTFLPSYIASKWLDCKREEALKSGTDGIHILPTVHDESNIVTFEVAWVPPPNRGEAHIKLTLNAKPFVRSDIPPVIPVNGKISFDIKRRNTDALSLIVSEQNGSTDHAFVDAETSLTHPSGGWDESKAKEIDPSFPCDNAVEIGQIPPGKVMIFEAKGTWYPSTTQKHTNTNPGWEYGVSGHLQVNMIDPSGKRRTPQFIYINPVALTGPLGVSACISDSVYADNGAPLNLGPRAELYPALR